MGMAWGKDLALGMAHLWLLPGGSSSVPAEESAPTSQCSHGAFLFMKAVAFGVICSDFIKRFQAIGQVSYEKLLPQTEIPMWEMIPALTRAWGYAVPGLWVRVCFWVKLSLGIRPLDRDQALFLHVSSCTCYGPCYHCPSSLKSCLLRQLLQSEPQVSAFWVVPALGLILPLYARRNAGKSWAVPFFSSGAHVYATILHKERSWSQWSRHRGWLEWNKSPDEDKDGWEQQRCSGFTQEGKMPAAQMTPHETGTWCHTAHLGMEPEADEERQVRPVLLRTGLRRMELALTNNKEWKETSFRNRSLQSHLKDWSFLKN